VGGETLPMAGKEESADLTAGADSTVVAGGKTRAEWRRRRCQMAKESRDRG
jgi:hypothetical protein